MQHSNRVAVIDLGSNTFHLLVVKPDTEKDLFSEVYRERRFVYLSKGGLKNISSESFYRGMQTLSDFKNIIERYNVREVVCVGTAALRSAANGSLFISEVKRKLDFDIELISGNREAELIFKGLSLSGMPSDRIGLATDIGGGSVEFIFFRNDRILSVQSVNIGISVLRNELEPSDSISNKKHQESFFYLTKHLIEIHDMAKKLKPTFLVGASGPFEILESMQDLLPSRSGNIISREVALNNCKLVMNASLDQRINIHGMPPNRADLSLESMLLIKYFLTTFATIQNIFISPYGLKEGLLAEYMNLD